VIHIDMAGRREFRVTVSGASFRADLERFKAAIPDAERRWDKDARCWFVAVSQVRALAALPNTTISPAVGQFIIADNDRRVVTFVESCQALGVDFVIDGDRVEAIGGGVSPVLQAETERRAADIVRLYGDGVTGNGG
jgi:hypothetical protein